MGKIVADSVRGKGKVAYIGVTREDKAVGAAREDGFRAGLRAEGVELEEGYTRKSQFTMVSVAQEIMAISFFFSKRSKAA